MTKEDLIKELQSLVSKLPDNFNGPDPDKGEFVNDWCCGNIDDAYSIGMDYGMFCVAKDIRELLNMAEFK